jgi:hypothetical protein
MQIRSNHLIRKVIRYIFYDCILCEFFFQKLGLHFLWDGKSNYFLERVIVELIQSMPKLYYLCFTIVVVLALF